MATGQGHKSYAQIGSESPSAWGTAVAATEKIEIISESIELAVATIPDPSLYNARSHRDIIDGGQHAAGALRKRANYAGGELQLLRAAMGAYAPTTVETGVRDHVFTEGDQRGLTLQLAKGDIPAGKVFRAIGMKPRGFTFEAPANGMATWEYDCLGKTMESDQTPTGALSFAASMPVLFSQVPSGQLVEGSGDAEADVRIRNLKITYNAPLTEDRFYIGPSANMDEPLPSDFVVCEWEIQQEFKTKSAFDLFKARTTSVLEVKFQHPTTIGAASKRELHFRSQSAKLMGYSNPVEAYGILIATARWRSYYYAGDLSSLYVRIRNTEVALA